MTRRQQLAALAAQLHELTTEDERAAQDLPCIRAAAALARWSAFGIHHR